MNDIRTKLVSGASWLMAARIISNLVGFVSTLILARLLLPEDFGLVAIAVTITAIVTSLTELSVGSVLIHFESIEDDHLHTAWTLGFARGVCLGVLLAGLAWPVAWAYDDPRLVAIMLAMAVVTLGFGLINPRMVVFTRALSFRQEALVNLGQKVATLPATVAIAWAFHSYWAIVVGQFAALIFQLVTSYLLIPYRPRFRLYDLRRIFGFSVWLSLQQAINTVNWKTDPLLISYVAGPTALGHYTVGDNLASLPTREALGPLSATLFPGFARVVGDREALQLAYLRAQTLLSLIAFPMGFGLALLAAPAIALVLGERWLPAIPVVQLLAGIFASQTVASTLQPLSMAMGETRLLFRRDLLNFFIRLPIVVTGVLLDGLIGAVIARCLSSLIGTAIGMHLVRQLLELPLRRQLLANVRTLLATSAMVGGVLLLETVVPDLSTKHPVYTILITVIAGAIFYIGTIAGLWWATGFQPGPESDLLQILGRLARPFRRRGSTRVRTH